MTTYINRKNEKKYHYLFSRFLTIILLFCLIHCFGIRTVSASIVGVKGQQVESYIIKGVVTDAKGLVLPGAYVLLKGTYTGTSTDNKGEFSLEVSKNEDAILAFSFIGMETQEIKIGSKLIFEIALEEKLNEIGEIVAIGYQNVQKRKVTAAMTTIKSEDIQNIPYASVDQILSGKIAGLTVLSPSGEPGANTVVNIRGSSSVSLGGVSYPLYVIDGIVYDVNDLPSAYGNNPLTALNPNEIESIDVLKDASAAAIYGSRGANGVILVKTKTASNKDQKPTFRLNMYTGMSLKPSLRSVITGRLERQAKLDLLYNTYGNLNNTETSLFLTDSLNVAFNNNTDWQDLFTQNSSIINVDASVSGSFGKNQYRVSMGYYKEDGVMVGYGLKRVSPKLYLSLNPSEKVNITVNFIPSFVDIDHGLGNGSTFPFSTWGFPSSFLKVDEDQIAIYKGETGYDEDKTTSLISNVRLNILFSKDLTFTSSYSNTYRSNRRDYLTDALLISGSDQNLAESWNYKTTIWDIENYFTYSKQIKEHSFSAILGQQASKQINESSYVSGRGVLGNTVYGLSSGNDLYAYSYADRKTRLGVFGRANYDFKGRYLFSSSYRRDASSRYNQYKHWTDFYSISGGWIISDEGFFSNLKSTINFLKFRASYGVTGNDPASYYARYNLYESNGTYEGSSFGIGSNTTAKTYNGVNAIVQDYDGYAGSKNVTWEKYPQANIGLDFSLFNNRIQVQADWYARDSENLFNSTLVAPVTSGYSYYSGNVIDVRNTGYELTLSTINLGKNSKLKWNTSLTLAFNDNYVTKLPNGGQDLTVGASWQQYTLTVGQPLFQYRVWETKGVYDTDEAVPTDPLTGSKMTFYGATIRKGDPKYVDQNGDYNIDMNDKQYAGDPNPKVAGGINNTFVYKGWSLSVFCNFILGREIWNGYVSDALNGSKTANPWVDWGNRATVGILGDINYYTGAGDTDAEYGTIVNNYSTVDRFHVANSKFIEDGSFFRIKNISLGYTVPESFVDRLGVSSLRLYGMVDNVLLLTNSTLPDPEAVGANGTSDGNNYPLSLKFTFGLTVSF